MFSSQVALSVSKPTLCRALATPARLSAMPGPHVSRPTTVRVLPPPSFLSLNSLTLCPFLSADYSQCQPSSATTTATSPTSSSSLCPGTRTKFAYFGVNESGAEFGNTVIPGQLGKDYTWPSPSSIDYFVGQGFNTFRIPFLMERMSPPTTGGLGGPFNQTYLSGLKTIVSYITGKGGYAVVDRQCLSRHLDEGTGMLTRSRRSAQLHDLQRRDHLEHEHVRLLIPSHPPCTRSPLTPFQRPSFQAWWKQLATEFATDSHVIFDLQNEPHDIPAATVFSLMQAGLNGVRSAGATSQLILVEGTSYTGAWTWTTTSGNSEVFGAIKDPNNNVAIRASPFSQPLCSVQ